MRSNEGGVACKPGLQASAIVPFHKDFSPSGEQLEHRKSAHEL